VRVVSKKALIATLFVFFLDNFGMYVVFPIFTPLVLKIQGGILQDPVSMEARMFFLSLLIASFPLAQFFGAPLFGTFGDTFGRKRALLLTLLGEAIGYALSAFAIAKGSYSFLLASRFITGFFAGNMAICLAIVSDHTEDKFGRYKLYGIQTGLLGLSFVIAVGIGGFLSNRALGAGLDPSLPFWITCGLSLFNIILISAMYQESTVPSREDTSFTPFRTARLKLIFVSFFLFALGYLPTLQFLSAFMLENFNSSRLVISISFACVGVAWFLGSIIVNPLLLRWITPHKITLTSIRLDCIFLFISCCIPLFWVFNVSFYLYVILAALVWSGMTTKLSFDCPARERGRLMGITQSVLTLAALLGPLIIGFAGKETIRFGYFICLAFIFISSFVFYYYIQKIVSYFNEN